MVAIRDLVVDTATMVNITMASNNTSDFATINNKFANGGVSQHDAISSYIQRLELKMYKQSIRIIELENKLDSEECQNLKKMLESNDEASVILAKEIIDNLETT